jgi:hypothetical protein
LFFYHRRHGALCCWDSAGRGLVGDVTKESVLDIWNGPIMKSMREPQSRPARPHHHALLRCDAYADVQFVGFDVPPSGGARGPSDGDQIIKRNGEIVRFDPEKIVVAIYKAAAAVGATIAPPGASGGRGAWAALDRQGGIPSGRRGPGIRSRKS